MIPKYTRVRKTVNEKGDLHKIGATGEIVSVIEHETVYRGMRIECGYFVVWDDFPVPVFVCDYKIEPVAPQ